MGFLPNCTISKQVELFLGLKGPLLEFSQARFTSECITMGSLPNLFIPYRLSYHTATPITCSVASMGMTACAILHWSPQEPPRCKGTFMPLQWLPQICICDITGAGPRKPRSPGMAASQANLPGLPPPQAGPPPAQNCPPALPEPPLHQPSPCSKVGAAAIISLGALAPTWGCQLVAPLHRCY